MGTSPQQSQQNQNQNPTDIRYGEGVGQLSPRLPDSLHDQAREAAEQEGISLNTWLCHAVERSVASVPRSPTLQRMDRVERELMDLKRKLTAVEKVWKENHDGDGEPVSSG